MQVDDERLQSTLARDVDGTFERLVLSYQDRLYRFGLRLTGNSQDAEEIAQDAFVRGYHALVQYSPDRIQSLSLQAWLYQIALNVFRNRVRRRRVRQVALNGDVPVEDRRKLPEHIAEDAEREHELAALITTLPERHRTAVILRHIEGLSYSEVADILDQPVGTVKANVHRGLQTLRTTLTDKRSEVTL
ncbi:MAG: RNA polymerase sigma factor [Chloroflexota bacterium]